MQNLHDSSTNYGERLYQKGMRRKEEVMKTLEALQKQRDEIESGQYSFRPVICGKSRMMAEANGRTSR
jgi:cell division protein YceG involved in septum cleavage